MLDTGCAVMRAADSLSAVGVAFGSAEMNNEQSVSGETNKAFLPPPKPVANPNAPTVILTSLATQSASPFAYVAANTQPTTTTTSRSVYTGSASAAAPPPPKPAQSSLAAPPAPVATTTSPRAGSAGGAGGGGSASTLAAAGRSITASFAAATAATAPPPAREFKSASHLRDKMRKHTRLAYDPKDKFRAPVTTSHEYGWFEAIDVCTVSDARTFTAANRFHPSLFCLLCVL